MQSKSTFPARIAPFSVPLGRMEAVQGLRKARFERETWTYFALLYLHNRYSKNQRSAEIISDRTRVSILKRFGHSCTGQKIGFNTSEQHA